MRKLIAVLLLEAYAALLTVWQSMLQVRTDEAKYLLNIPYPHPPLVRSILHSLDGYTYQEWFWRFVFASLLIQGVWLAIRLVHDRSLSTKIAVALPWLFCMSMLTQAGTIMMAPLTALEGWVFLFLYLQNTKRSHTGLIGIFWLVSLFTAYQAVLFFPVVLALLWRQNVSVLRKLLAFCVPVFLLALYTLTNPLVLASLLLHADHVSTLTKVWELSSLWLLSGSIVLSIAGLYGMIRERLWFILASLLVVAAYIALARFSYYGILFVPLSMAGFIALVRSQHFSAWFVTAGTLVVTIFLFLWFPVSLHTSTARRTMERVQEEGVTGTVYILGTFGHEWQYESRLPLRRLSAPLFPDAHTVICLEACPTLDNDPAWRQVSAEPPFLYVR